MIFKKVKHTKVFRDTGISPKKDYNAHCPAIGLTVHVVEKGHSEEARLQAQRHVRKFNKPVEGNPL